MQANWLKRYQTDPCAFVREILGVTTNSPKQDEILLSVLNNPRTAVRACNGGGKTVMAAELVVWVTTCFPGSLVITTAASGRQVEKQMWAEVGNLHRKARRPLGGELLATELRFLKTGSRAIGFSTDDPGRLEGWHARYIFVIIDEAKSVPPEIFDAVERLLSAGAWVRLLVMSSPGSPVGPFYDIFAKQSHLYSCHHISAYDSPFIRREWIEERKQQWGESSSLFLSAVLGEFPPGDQDGIVIPLAHLQRLLEQPPAPVGDVLRAGVDLAAGGGDESVVAVMRGNTLIELKAWRERDTMVTAGNIINIIEEFQIPSLNVNVDADGLGRGIVDRLRERGYEVTEIHSGAEAREGKQYFNRIAEMWGTAKLQIEQREVALLDDPILTAQLTSRRMKPRSDGRFQLESKIDMRNRGLPSPDRADALILALAADQSAASVPELQMLNSDTPSDPKKKSEEEYRHYIRLCDENADKIRNGQPALSDEEIRKIVWPEKQ